MRDISILFLPSALSAFITAALAYTGMFVTIRYERYTEYAHDLQFSFLITAAVQFALACLLVVVID